MNKTDKLKNMLQNGIVTATEMKKENIPSSIITILVKRGEAKRLARGVYASSEAGFSDMSDYETLAANTDGIFCLISALRLHGLTDENPHDLCMAIKRGYHPPRHCHIPITIIYRTRTYPDSVEIRHSHGVALRIYTVEQTIADCFQYRNKIGLDVAVSALKDAVRQQKVDWNKLWEAARRCRVTKIMRPYMEAIS